MVRKFLLIIAVLILCLRLYDQGRTTYCLDGTKCITVWKRIGGKCYIILEKYDGLTAPRNNFVETSNKDDIDIIWLNNNHIYIYSKFDAEFNFKNSKSVTIHNYRIDKKNNDRKFLFFDGEYNRYKPEIQYLSINIKDNYALGSKGERY